MTEAVYLKSAEYRGGFKLYLEFSTGEAGEVDLEDIIFRYQQAEPLREPTVKGTLFNCSMESILLT